MLSEWTRQKLEAVREHDRVLVRDSLRLLSEADGTIHSFARENGFTVIVASTNLVFRELYEKALADKETKRLLVIDRAPARRRISQSLMKAPPPFYPDFLDETVPETFIDLDLRQFLIDKTGDVNWPWEVNDPRYARLIVRNLDGVLNAHRNLRNADGKRFSDHDLKTIVAYAALGVADSAFKKLTTETYWEIGLLGHDALQELESLAPEITRPINDELAKAPAPFCWFSRHDTETVLRSFYLSLILSQHFEHWNILLANIDPTLHEFASIQSEILVESAPKLVRLDPDQAASDLAMTEEGISKDALKLLFLDQMDLALPSNFTAVLEKERYSVVFRSLALLMALDNLLSSKPDMEAHERLWNLLFEMESDEQRFIEKRSSEAWRHLKEAYRLATRTRGLRQIFTSELKQLKMMKDHQVSFKKFDEIWNGKGTNRLEYFASSLERHVWSGDFLPRHEDGLPSAFANALRRIREQARTIGQDVQRELDEANLIFQRMVVRDYGLWASKDTDVCLTSQFLRRCLKPNWDPETEKAVLFIFDGMRCDIWDEFLRPMLEERMQRVKEYPGVSLLPSETHITRKAISAGAFPDAFDTGLGEDKLLKQGLKKEFNYDGEVNMVSPDTMGTGETVRYRAGNLDVYIFELCDTTLHHIPMKPRPEGGWAPARPLSFIYEQQLKNIIDTEVTAIVRKLAPGTKVFVVADHGFGPVHREALRLEITWLNEPNDCRYRNARLRQPLDTLKAPKKVRDNAWEIAVADLKMPSEEDAYDKKTNRKWAKEYSSVIFPKVGYSFARTGPGSHFNPDAYSHGGISIQELMVPMACLKVRDKDEGILTLGEIIAPAEVVEGQDISIRLPINLSRISETDLRVDVEADCSGGGERRSLSGQVLYVNAQGVEALYSFRPDPADATDDERQGGSMIRTLTMTVSYREGRQAIRNSRTHRFSVRLNSEQIIRRVPAHLGNILGLTPKSMR